MTQHFLAFLILMILAVLLLFAIIITEVVSETDTSFGVYALLEGMVALLIALAFIPVYFNFHL